MQTGIRSGWSPLVTEAEDRDDLFEALRAIVHSPEPIGRTNSRDPSLAGGQGGWALFYAYQSPSPLRSPSRLLQAVTTALANRPLGPSLFSGTPGLGWVLAHLKADREGLNDQLDCALSALLRAGPWKGPLDLISGAIGLGVYALERLPRPEPESCIRSVLDVLEAHARPQHIGISWWRTSEQIGRPKQPLYPKGCFDLGLAHGVAGAIAFLARVKAAGIEESRARQLAQGAATWLLSQERPEAWIDGSAYFPSMFDPDQGPPPPARGAWCYGDPGIASALFLAGRAFDVLEWRSRALVIARSAARRPPSFSRVDGVGLCHGAAGLGHLFNRLAQASGDEELREAARSWILRTAELVKGAIPNNRTLLEGTPGVGLTLLAALSSIEPTWDRAFLLSL